MRPEERAAVVVVYGGFVEHINGVEKEVSMCVCEDEEEVVVRNSESEGRDPGWLGRVRLSQRSAGSFHFDSAQSFCGSGAPDAPPGHHLPKAGCGSESLELGPCPRLPRLRFIDGPDTRVSLHFIPLLQDALLALAFVLARIKTDSRFHRVLYLPRLGSFLQPRFVYGKSNQRMCYTRSTPQSQSAANVAPPKKLPTIVLMG